MVERTGLGFLSECSCLLPALSTGSVIKARRLASLTDSVQVRNTPESNALSAPHATPAERTPVWVVLHVTFGPLSFGGRARCVETHQPGPSLRGDGAPPRRAPSAKRTGPVAGHIQHVSSSARSRWAVPRGPRADRARREPVGFGMRRKKGLHSCSTVAPCPRPTHGHRRLRPAPAPCRPTGRPSRATANDRREPTAP